ncbi:AAA family ATPase [Arsenicicoccus piscis]|uniref:Phosphate acetyltransferase n=1 Tax=Arsenicicoccus piscis TaxID=673954 RepID=A0ABQ6HN29_9MICO|nr:hypothetical protein GCM10025862_18760 [Arsenicicoccus piscis]
MNASVYVASPVGHSGKSAVVLGLLDALNRSHAKVGVYRPVTASTPEQDTVLLTALASASADLTPAEAVGVTYDDVHNDPDAALSRIVERFHELERRCDVVVVVGSDFTDVASPTEFAFNAHIAANLGSPVLLVVGADGPRPRTSSR